MSVAYYMEFTEGHHGAPDRIGGLPTHLPEVFPKCVDTGEEMAFLSQFYSSQERFNVSGALCIQLYQCLGVDEGEDPTPIAVIVPLGASLNEADRGTPQPTVVPYDVSWVRKEDPDEYPVSGSLSPEILQLHQSKAGGLPPRELRINPNKFLGQLTEYPAELNFGGLLAAMYLDDRDEIRVELL
jgi:hypothetical protein